MYSAHVSLCVIIVWKCCGAKYIYLQKSFMTISQFSIKLWPCLSQWAILNQIWPKLNQFFTLYEEPFLLKQTTLFLRYVGNRQTNRQTDKRRWKHYPPLESQAIIKKRCLIRSIWPKTCCCFFLFFILRFISPILLYTYRVDI